MLGVGSLPPPSAPPLVLTKAANKTTITFSLLFQCKTHRKNLLFFPELQQNYSSLCLRRNGFSLFAQKKQKDASFGGIELERQEIEDGFEIDEDDDGFDEVFDEDLDDNDDEDEDDDVIVPFHEMDAWLEKKPKGFGEGKVYDTSLEDKLLEELEKSRIAQLANINKLKNEAKEPKLNTELKKEVKVSEGAIGGVRVCINNLPKKKNIHRDLKSAFEGVHGIINILPVVSGNKKTRDPVCKGFAFADFKSLEDANKFVQLFSGQNIAFGKNEKQIKCKVLKSSDASDESSEHGRHNSISESSITVSAEEGDQVDDSEKDDIELEYREDDDDDEFDEDPYEDDVIGNLALLSASKQGDSDGAESGTKQLRDSSSSNQKEKKTAKKKPVAKKKPDNSPKLKIPGSAKRLKVQEKAKLADVFSRYGVKQTLVSKEM